MDDDARRVLEDLARRRDAARERARDYRARGRKGPARRAEALAEAYDRILSTAVDGRRGRVRRRVLEAVPGFERQADLVGLFTTVREALAELYPPEQLLAEERAALAELGADLETRLASRVLWERSRPPDEVATEEGFAQAALQALDLARWDDQAELVAGAWHGVIVPRDGETLAQAVLRVLERVGREVERGAGLTEAAEMATALLARVYPDAVRAARETLGARGPRGGARGSRIGAARRRLGPGK